MGEIVAALTFHFQREELEEDDLEETLLIERVVDLTPEGQFTPESASAKATVSEELEEQLKHTLKTLKKLQPALIPDKNKRDDVQKQVLAVIVQAIASQYPTSLEEDEALLTNAQGREKMAIIVRMGEKRILEELKNGL